MPSAVRTTTKDRVRYMLRKDRRLTVRVLAEKIDTDRHFPVGVAPPEVYGQLQWRYGESQPRESTKPCVTSQADIDVDVRQIGIGAFWIFECELIFYM